MPGYAIAAIIIGAFIAVLCVPIELLFIFNADEMQLFHLRISWFYGLVGMGKGSHDSRSLARKRRVSASFRAGSIWKIVQMERAPERFMRFIWDIRRVCRVKDIDVDIRFGLGDPADTALLFAAVGLPVKFFCSSLPYRVSIEPAFSEEAVIAGHFYLVSRMRPVHIIVPFLRLCSSLGIINLIRIMAQFKWTRKNS